MIVASGARYQRLAVDDLERFEGAGVYYAATDLEARICTGLRRHRRRRRQLRRPGRDLPRAAGQPGVDRDPAATTSPRACRATSSSGSRPTRASSCSPCTEVRALDGDSHLEQRHPRAHADRRAAHDRLCAGCSASSAPTPRPTGWAARSRSTTAGFVLTDRSLPDAVHERAALRGTRSAAVRDVGPGRVRGRRRAQRFDQARRRRGRRGIERGAVGARPPRRRSRPRLRASWRARVRRRRSCAVAG